MKRRLIILLIVFLLLSASVLIYGPYANRPYRGMDWVEMSIMITVLFTWMVTWILPGILLSDVPGGSRVYGINLAPGLVVLIIVLLIVSTRPVGAWDFGNLIRGFIALIGYGVWGFILLIYAIQKRKSIKIS